MTSTPTIALKNEDCFLGIDSGATRTVVILADSYFRLRLRLELPGANFRLTPLEQWISLLQQIRDQTGIVRSIGLGVAGVRNAEDSLKLRSCVEQVWPGVPSEVTHDLETALLANSLSHTDHCGTVLVLAGTGSCCYGVDPSGVSFKIGGWGHVLGDRGSGYEIALRGLRLALFQLEHKSRDLPLVRGVLSALHMVKIDSDALIRWSLAASKAEIARFAPIIFNAAQEGCIDSQELIRDCAFSLSQDAAKCMKCLIPQNWDSVPVRFVFSGSVLVHQKSYANEIETLLRNQFRSSTYVTSTKEAAWGAVVIARKAFGAPWHFSTDPCIASDKEHSSNVNFVTLPVTEKRNPRSMNLDQMPIREGIALMLSEESVVCGRLMEKLELLTAAVALISESFKNGGRLFYVGAGTSGRLGVLDASECPPTFSTPPSMVQGIIAGGEVALTRAVEGAEDDYDAGFKEMFQKGILCSDVVVGIAASGKTPFVMGALAASKSLKAKSILVSFNPAFQPPMDSEPDLMIAFDVGPEVLTGSTRLKSGTATKLVLNTFTTIAMVQLGKVIQNLMVDLNPSNEKLRGRAIRILQELAGVTENEARRELIESRWNIKLAFSRLQTLSEPSPGTGQDAVLRDLA